MSTYWGYYCKECEVESDHWWNHGKKQLKELFEIAPELNKIMASVKHIDIDVGLLGCDTWHDEQPLDWLKEHEGHNICLKNEYGDMKEFNAI